MITALLVRWSGGWLEVTDAPGIEAYGRREALIGLGAVQSTAEAERVARQQLAIYATPRTAIQVAPVDTATVPLLGDRVTVPDIDGTPVLERVMSRTFTEDDDGLVTFAADVRDVILADRERWEQALKKMSDGTLRGDTKVATPASLVSLPDPTCCPPVPPGGSG